MDTEVASWLKAFMDLRPPTFKGQFEADPSVAKFWLEDIHHLLEYMDCPKSQWERCATFMLTEHAKVWWRLTVEMLKK